MSTPQDTVERALALSKADGCVVRVVEHSETNLRWANNTVTTNGEMRSRRLAVLSFVDGAAGAAVGAVERTAVTPDAIEEVVRASEAAAAANAAAADAAPLVDPIDDAGGHPGAAAWADEPAATTVDVFRAFAPALGEAFGRARAADRLLFGFAEHSIASIYLGTSTGLRLRHDQPTGRVELNGKADGFARSAWAGVSTRDFTDVDVTALDAEVGRRLDWSARRIDVAPGRHETIVPPSAVADLMVYLYWSSGARDADEGRTVFSARGGGSRIGERLSPLPLTLRSDPHEPGLQAAPFTHVTASWFGGSAFDNGAPTRAIDWISDGVLRELPRTRQWAAESGVPDAPVVDNLIMEQPGATATTADLVASTRRGLLLTCLWYVREVDPRTLLLTGLTRDGVYVVEDGEVVGEATNFRFNESPVGMLARATEVGRSERTLCREFNDYFTRTAMPAIRVPDFNMSTTSKAS